MNWGQSDFLYVSLHSAEQTEAFVKLLELFGKHKFTLECAFPTAVSLIQQRFKIELYEARVCTDFKSNRGTPKMVKNCLNDNLTYEVFHPLKVSKYGNWSQIFKYFVLGQGNISLTSVLN